MTTPSANIEILLVEDNPADVVLTREALKRTNVPLNINVVEDGEEAILYLRCQGAYNDRPTPNIVLLDLNLPKVDGREVLRMIKSDNALKSIPVVVLTTSRADSDISETYRLHGNCFVSKPLSFKEFLDAVKSIQQFWFSVVSLPSA